jgi:hypothetical protein
MGRPAIKTVERVLDRSIDSCRRATESPNVNNGQLGHHVSPQARDNGALFAAGTLRVKTLLNIKYGKTAD